MGVTGRDSGDDDKDALPGLSGGMVVEVLRCRGIVHLRTGADT